MEEKKRAAVQLKCKRGIHLDTAAKAFEVAKATGCPCSERASGRGVIRGLWAGESGGRCSALSARHPGGSALIF